MRTSRAALCATVLLVLGSAPQFAEAYWALGWWSHSYQASVYITSPTQNLAYQVGSQPNVDYGGGSASAYASISYVGDPGLFQIDLEAWIDCNWGAMFVQDVQHEDVVAPSACGSPEGVAVAEMQPWNPLAYERGATILCENGVAVAAWHRDSFREIFTGSYTPTRDPCRVDLVHVLGGSTIGGMHSHPRFTSNAQLNRGVTCHGDGPYNLSAFQINNLFNNPNTAFQDHDFNWPPETGTPFFLLVPLADEIKVLTTNLQTFTVWSQ